MLQFKEKARENLKLYKSYFAELLKAISRSDSRGDYLKMTAINAFREQVRAIPRMRYQGKIDTENEEMIEKVLTVLRRVDNYCDEFLNLGIQGSSDKLFYMHIIREFQSKFEIIKIE